MSKQKLVFEDMSDKSKHKRELCVEAHEAISKAIDEVWKKKGKFFRRLSLVKENGDVVFVDIKDFPTVFITEIKRNGSEFKFSFTCYKPK
jgi:hypothetical protein